MSQLNQSSVRPTPKDDNEPAARSISVGQQPRTTLSAGPSRRSSIFTRVMVALSLLIIAVLVAFAFLPSLFAPQLPTTMNASAILKSPGGSHLLGTDYFGRDIFSLIIYGSRDSILIGVASVLLGGIVGTLIGSVAGYAGKWTDSLLMRLIDTLMTIPGILLALTIAAALGPSKMNLILAVSVSSVPGFARIMRGQVLSIKNRPYIEAARAIGTPHRDILFRHILPNSYSPLLVMATIGVGSAILIGSGLSFLGLGVVSEIPDWGTLLSQGRSYLSVAWWMATFPGVAITLLVVSVNVLGDELRTMLNPKKGHS